MFYEDRAARRNINLYRKSMESVIGLVVYTLKSDSMHDARLQVPASTDRKFITDVNPALLRRQIVGFKPR